MFVHISNIQKQDVMHQWKGVTTLYNKVGNTDFPRAALLKYNSVLGWVDSEHAQRCAIFSNNARKMTARMM